MMPQSWCRDCKNAPKPKKVKTKTTSAKPAKKAQTVKVRLLTDDTVKTREEYKKAFPNDTGSRSWFYMAQRMLKAGYKLNKVAKEKYDEYEEVKI